ncbi:MAG: methylated-DNA--[protein]-cysteine S-methyltransferase [Bacteroidales bacterium]|nr:methylated-DNA--[protein]-cysteine S-methyltransferase [Bacteroidales bacterium]
MDHEIKIEYFKTKFGELIIGSFENKLCLCDWRYRKMRNSVDKNLKTRLNADFIVEGTAISQKTKNQLNEYFEGQRKEFDIPLYLVGSDFQIKVWNKLLSIPYGKTESYLGLSKKLGDEKAIRAVASANGANQISIIVPCHRIVGSNGKLVGYAGGLQVKMKLLNLENAIINGQMRLF